MCAVVGRKASSAAAKKSLGGSSAATAAAAAAAAAAAPPRGRHRAGPGTALADISKNTASSAGRPSRASKLRSLVSTKSGRNSSNGNGHGHVPGRSDPKPRVAAGGGPGRGGVTFFDDWFFFVLFVVKLAEVEGLCLNKNERSAAPASGGGGGDRGGSIATGSRGGGVGGEGCRLCRCGGQLRVSWF